MSGLIWTLAGYTFSKVNFLKLQLKKHISKAVSLFVSQQQQDDTNQSAANQKSYWPQLQLKTSKQKNLECKLCLQIYIDILMDGHTGRITKLT